MREIGLEDVQIDATSNAVGRIKGRSGKAIVFITTLDDLATIAELQRTGGKRPHREADKVIGPATEVQSVNAATLLAAEALVRAKLTPEHDIVFASVSQEETGLIGMNALYKAWKDRAVGWIDVLGDGQEIVYGAGFVHWWRIVAQGSGGHTEEGGKPTVNLGIARAVDRILSLTHAIKYDYTFINVGIIRSGKVYNHKPSSGWFSLDLRSMKGEVIHEIETEVKAVLKQVESETGIRFGMQSVTKLEGGQVPGSRESRLVQLAVDVSRHLGYDSVVSPRGCCNMSIPISQGRLAIGLHGVRGGLRATAEEWASIPAMMRTAKFVTLLAAAY
jgi:acetylornithine deacetylase/succinyl-diaminopimelate desuccinylase-like protein